MVTWTKRGRDEDGGMLKRLMTVMLLTTMTFQHTSADIGTLIHMTARSLRERPERAALEPPTVTSLKPPDRNRGGGRGAAGISVRGEQSGSHIPPVVASRSPSSSSSSRDYKDRYTHINSRYYQPTSPLATASSGSRTGTDEFDARRRSPLATRPVELPPAPHLVNGTTLSIPQESSWVPPVSYGPPPPRGNFGSAGYAPRPRSYPRHPGSSQYNNEGGVWRETEDEPTEGLWGNSRRHPSYPQSRHRNYGHSVMEDSLRRDTFGHRISEDLSHLSSEYPPRRTNPRSQVNHPVQNIDDSTLGGQPQEADIHIVNQNGYHPRNRNRHMNVTDQNSSPSQPRGGETNSSIRRLGMAPTAYGSRFDSDRTPTQNVRPQDDTIRDESHNSHGRDAHNPQHPLGFPHHEPLPPTTDERDDSRRVLTLYEVWHMINMTTWEEFVEFLQTKDIKVSQVLSNINGGATREEMLDFLNNPDLNQNITQSAEYPNPVPSTPMSQTEETEEVTHRHSAGKARGERKKNRHKGKNKKRGRKNRENRKRGRKDKNPILPDVIQTTIIPPIDKSVNGSMNQSTSQEPAVTLSPPISTTTAAHVILPSGVITQEPSVTIPLLITESTLIEHIIETKTIPSIQSQLPIQAVPIEQTTPETPRNTSSLTQDTAVDVMTTVQPPLNTTDVLEQIDLPLWPILSGGTPSAAPAIFLTRVTTMSPTLGPSTTEHMKSVVTEDITPPTILPAELNPATKTMPLPTSMVPRAGSLTLPPMSKPSEVSIISFTVMKAPKQGTQEETILEDITPIRKGHHHRQLHKKTRKLRTQRLGNQPRLLSSATPREMDDGMVIRTPFVREERKNKYTFPVKGFMIITGIMGALAVFTLVVLISYAIIKCSKQPVVNNYQVSEQKPSTQ